MRVFIERMSGTESYFSRETLLEMAAEVEKAAEKFYTVLADKFPEHVETLRQLARDEVRHAETYVNLLRRKGVVSTGEDRRRAEQHLKALESLGILTFLRKGEEAASKVKSWDEAAELALRLEKETLLFYQNLTLFLGKEDRREVYKIMDTEYTHLLIVSRLRESE
ncbi:hypothetical protein J7L70_01130 [Candidatus Bathyarchaeota archaeon]|nr:hypothetical protein [Candidatus Bathyarchaeota archaeon]